MSDPTQRDEDRIGICRACREWTSLRESCCGALVLIDGAWTRPDDESDDATEVNTKPEAQ